MKIYFARSSDINSASAEEWMACLPDEKRQRIGRLKHAEHRNLALTAQRLLCFSLKREFSIVPSPDDWGVGEFGKPYLKSAEGVCFNISHSGCVAMCAVHDKPVGADIEHIRPVDDSLAKRIMSDEEWQAYQNAIGKVRLFFKVWTLKEAYLKYGGTGISDALDRLIVYPAGNTIRTNTEGCRFALIDSVDGYQAAVCADTPDFDTPEWIENAALME
ncbi:MAG: 4'-phosphopantetheinyl transferase superfamily protein [Eubacteriales bacterium]|nr:4'-phosphopantetheinyl transferase superfamily protein [Eubacteriales bacterium]